ncbi:MAG: outer membrane beta-barrel protein, partial [Bacteroidia bacterium]
QEDKTWRLGIQWGTQGNHAKFEGGMSDANARFHQNKFGGGALGLIARYDFNHRWMVTSGLGLNSYGFEFALAENYSFIHKGKRFSTIKSEFGGLEIPAMLYHKFNPNCKNARWLIGGGFVETFIGAQTMDKNISQAADGGTNVNYLSSTTTVKGGTYFMIRWAVAREKTFKCGSILNASLVFNAGFKDIAHATVNYTVDNQNYTHNFSNNGNFVGFRLAYFFKALNTSGQKTQAKKKVKMD